MPGMEFMDNVIVYMIIGLTIGVVVSLAYGSYKRSSIIKEVRKFRQEQIDNANDEIKRMVEESQGVQISYTSKEEDDAMQKTN